MHGVHTVGVKAKDTAAAIAAGGVLKQHPSGVSAAIITYGTESDGEVAIPLFIGIVTAVWSRLVTASVPLGPPDQRDGNQHPSRVKRTGR